jgi:hypothetical protein
VSEHGDCYPVKLFIVATTDEYPDCIVGVFKRRRDAIRAMKSRPDKEYRKLEVRHTDAVYEFGRPWALPYGKRFEVYGWIADDLNSHGGGRSPKLTRGHRHPTECVVYRSGNRTHVVSPLNYGHAFERLRQEMQEKLAFKKQFRDEVEKKRRERESLETVTFNAGMTWGKNE